MPAFFTPLKFSNKLLLPAPCSLLLGGFLKKNPKKQKKNCIIQHTVCMCVCVFSRPSVGVGSNARPIFK